MIAQKKKNSRKKNCIKENSVNEINDFLLWTFPISLYTCLEYCNCEKHYNSFEFCKMPGKLLDEKHIDMCRRHVVMSSWKCYSSIIKYSNYNGANHAYIFCTFMRWNMKDCVWKKCTTLIAIIIAVHGIHNCKLRFKVVCIVLRANEWKL